MADGRWPIADGRIDESFPKPLAIRHQPFALLFSAVAFAHDNIVGPEDRHGVRDHIPPRHVVKRPHVNERGSSDLQAVWLAAPGTDDVKTQFAFMGFRAAVNLATRRVESLREEFEL